MQKKAFSLVLTLLLAFMGVARAEVVTIGSGATTSNYLPSYSLYNNALSQQIYTAEEIGTAGSITSIAFFNAGTEKTRTYDVYMVNTTKTVFSDNFDWVPVSANDQVFSGSVTMVAGDWTTITLSTPFNYDGTSNLLLVMDDNTGSYSGGMSCKADNTSTSQALYIYSDPTNYDPSNPSNYSGTQPLVKNQIQLTFSDGSFEDLLHVKYMAGEEEIVDSLNMGIRPAGYWMEPFNFTMYSEGPTYTVTVLDFTPSDGMFSVEGEELPFQVVRNEDVDLTIATTEAAQAGVIERQFVAITEGNRAAHIWPIVVELYTPECPDVYELAYDLAENNETFPFVDVPVNRLENYQALHNDYTLPFPEIEEGMDAVYKLVFEQDQMLSASVTTGDNGKVALYTEEFNGQGGPMADNNYTGPQMGGGSTGAPFEAMIGDEASTTSTTYFPFHTLWNYSLAENLFLASELTEAGVTTAPMTSLSWNVLSTSSTQVQNNISIWMANVDDEALTANSHITNGMTLVYTGNNMPAPVAGWNEFVFNEGNFAWDGTSNILIVCQRNNGTYQGTVNWQSHNPGFAAMCYHYNDNNAYDAEHTSQSMYTSTTNRPNIIFKSTGRTDHPMTPAEPTAPVAEGISAGPVITNMPVEAGTYYLVASSTTDDFEVTINAEDMPCPDVNAEGFAFNPTPADDAAGIEPASVTLRWNVPTYATGWRVIIGTTYYPEIGHPQTIVYPEDGFATEMANSYTVRNLWNNTHYFWRVEFNNGSCEEGVSSPVWGFTTHLNIPTNLQANDYNIFEDESVTLTWNAVVDRTYRYYFIYQDGEKIDQTTVNQIGQTTYTVNNLAYNMDGYTFQVSAVYDEGESELSDPVTVKVSGYSNTTGINGYVWEQDGETGIQGALVTITGTDEFGDAHTYTATTNANGYYNKQVYAGNYTNAVATKDGYQETVTVHELPFTVAYNAQVDNVNFLMDENFDAPCTVIAEYYPDSLDPNSPYVKVYWGCGLPGEEIIEPFETGDFSLFDWQIDGNYPWSITTNNPYEGQYCMKSGGAGVANVVSNMTVTVDIPADGEMSFYGKISCEQNWDYGYFYIDGQQMGSYTGAGNWAERKFPITAGSHTFQWRYTKDGSVNANDDCFYVDYISFYHQPEPVQPGWVFYDDGVNVDAIGLTAGGSFYWGVMFPAGQYAGNSLTKVSMYDYTAHTGNIMVYQGGATAPGTLLYQQPYTCTGSEDFVEWTLNTPVAIDPTQNLWIVMNNNNGQYVASCCANTGDPNGRWISIDGTAWQDLVDAGLDYTFMVRAYVANGAKGEYIAPAGLADNWTAASQNVKKVAVKGETQTNLFAVSGNATKHNVGVPTRNGNTRSLSHYRVYRTNCYNDGPYTAENTVLLATVWVPDTVYIDVEWYDLPAGVYKWGVGAVYEGNRGELIESPITWAAPQAVNRSANFAAANGTAAGNHTGNGGVENRDGWLVYDDGINVDAIGLTAGGSFYWGVMFPAGSYTGSQLTKVSMYDYSAHNGEILIYQGGDNAPGTLVGQQDYTCTGSEDFVEWTMSTPVAIDPAQNLWIVMHNSNGQYVASIAGYCGDDNSQWISLDGSSWDGLYSTTGGAIDGTWMIRAYVEEGGNTPGGGSNLNELALPRESETIWSNCLDKDMFIVGDSINNGVTVNVLLNSADSPAGVNVTFTNYNEGEQELYPVAPIVLDETGFYAYPEFRKGEYQVKVEFDGYEPITDSVSIWNPIDLRYVMTEIIYGVDNLYVSRTGWAMWDAQGAAPGPQPQGGDDSFTEGFEGGLNGWTVIDAAGSEATWLHSDNNPGGYDYTTLAHGGTGFAMGYSFVDYVGAYNIDSYLVTPQKYAITANSHLTFWADNANDSYPESFSVCVATVDNPTANDFTAVWTGNAKANGGAKANVRRSDDNRYENWRSHNVDLSAYAGQNVWIAFHDVNYDAYEIWIDDVELTAGRENGDRHLEYFKVMCTSIDGEPIFNADTEYPFCQVNTDELVEGEHYICKVAAVYSTGMSEWSECVWQYESCENYAGTLNGVTIDGTTVSWDYPTGGPVPPIPPVPGDNAEIVLNVPTDIWGDGSGYQMLLDADATMYTQLAAVNYFNEIGSFDGFEYTIPENADYGISPANVVVGTSVTITVPAGTYDYAIINPDKVSTIWFAGAGNVESKGDDMVYEGGKRYTYTVSASGTGDAVNLTVTDRNGRTYQPTFQHVATGQVVRHSDNIASNREGQWYYYDNGNNMDAIGLSSGTMNFSWGIMFPAGSYTSGNLTKVGYYDYTAHTGNIHIYQGGTGNSAPGTEVYTQPYTVNGTETYIEIALAAPVAVDATQALWVVMESTTPGYTAAIDDSGSTNPNGGLVSTDGVSFSPIDVASGGGIVGNWNLRAYIEEGAPVPPIPAGNVLGAMIFADGEWEAFVEYPTNSYVYEGDAETVCVRMVYDGTAELPDNNYYYAMSCPECAESGDLCAPVTNLVGQYMNNEGVEGLYVDWEDPEGATAIRLYADGQLIGELPVGQHPIFLGFDGQVPEHTFMIGAQAIHPDCESEIVEVEVYYDDVIENEAKVALFPNPTTDNVTIQAEGMSHITVTSVLGQVVYDADVNGDEMVLNMGQFNAGMYMVRINTANGVVVKRVTVMQ